MIQTPVEFLQEALRIHFTHEQEMQFEGLFQQAKEMFDQQMIEFAEFVDKYPDKNRNFKGEILHAKSKYDESERTIDLLKTYLSKESDDDNSQTEISDEEIEVGFIEGAKSDAAKDYWFEKFKQQEDLYSKEDMKSYSRYVSKHELSKKWEFPLSPKEWFEQLKNKL